MKKYLLITAILFLAVTMGHTQINDYSWERLKVDAKNFYQIRESFDQYLSDQYPDSIPRSKLSNVKDFYRYQHFWKSRLGLVEDSLSYVPYAQAALNNLFDPYCDADDPAEWELLGPTNLPSQYLGLVDEVLSDPQNPGSYLLSSDRGGIWKNQTTGNSWVNVTDNLKLPGINASEMIRNPFNNNHIIASTAGGHHSAPYGMGIIESFDNGNTWTIQEGFDVENYPSVKKVIYDPNDNNPADGLTLWAITQSTNSGKIFVSHNSGIVWSEIAGLTLPDYSRFHDIEIDDQGTVWVTTINMYNSQDGGVYQYKNGIWYDISNDFDGIEYQQASLTKPYGGKIFVKLDFSGPNVSITKIYKTTNYGLTWGFIVEPSSSLSNKNQCEIEYSPQSNIIYLGGISIGLFKDDGAHQIKPIYKNDYLQHADIRDFDFIGIDENNYENLLVATDGGITLLKVNVNDITDFTRENLNGNHLPIGNTLGLGISHSDNEFIVAGAIHCGSFKYSNGNWIRFDGGDGADSEVNWDDPGKYYYQSWFSFKSSGNLYYSGDGWYLGAEYELNPNDPYIVYYGLKSHGSNNAQLRIFSERNDVTTIRNTPTYVSKVGAIGINTNNVIFFADYDGNDETKPNRFNVSYNNGENWDDMSFNPVNEFINGNWESTALASVIAYRTIEDIVCSPDNANEMWITIGGVKYEDGQPTVGKLRVLRSINGGESWYDYSENLPPFPVMALEYQKGSNSRLFAGTDAGVYYRDATMSQWECFNDGLPICIITDLDYDPCNKVLYASSQGRAIFKTDVPFTDDVVTTLDTNQIYSWNTPREIANDLIVPSGTTLTITSNIYLAQGVKIIVQPGGKLILNGGTLTNACGGLWQGVEVWGNPELSQIPANQGWLSISNGGTIENAVVAVRMGISGEANPDGGGLPPIDYKGGGILSSSEGLFRNNRSGVIFHEYPGNNLSSFTLSTFETTAELADGTTPLDHIRLLSVEGISIKACTFRNTRDASIAYSQRGIGIQSFDASYLIDHFCISATYPCTEYQMSEFTDLNYGIYATASNTTDYPSVLNTLFTDNYRGLYLGGITNARITSNNFNLNGTASDKSYGLYLDGCTGYWVEDNTFAETGLSTEKGIGIVVNQSGPEPNLIYLNAFNYVEYAINVQGNNRNGRLPAEGLEIRCNHYDNTLFDETIIYEGPADPPPSTDGIAAHQGRNTLNAEDMAGNLFYYNTDVAGDFDDINNQSNHFYYYYPSNAGIYKVEPLDYTRTTVTKVKKTLYNWTYEEGCPSGLSGGGTVIEGAYTAMAEAQADIQNTEAVLLALIDGGDTETLNAEVESSIPPEAAALYNELMAESPNLSETVVESTIEKETVLPNAMVRDVMVANPHSSTSLQLLGKLDERSIPMPEYMKAQIVAGRSISSLKAELEGELAMYKKHKVKAMNRIARHLNALPASPARTDSLLALYQADNSLSSRYMLAWLYMQNGQYLLGQNVMTAIPSDFTLTADELIEHQNMQSLYTMLTALYEAGKQVNDLSAAQQAQLETVVLAKTGLAAIFARNLLVAIDAIQYAEPVILPNQTKSASAEEAYIALLNTPMPKILEVYPNPSKDFVVLGYHFDADTRGIIEIRDVSGSLIQSIPFDGMQDQLTVMTGSWSPGIYMVSLMVNEKVIETTKFTLIN